jgi:four helix bundle protein
MRDYKKIKAWSLADDLAVEVYKQTRSFPSDEKYTLPSQIRRASYSVPANIADGAGRRTTKDLVRCLDMANGSINETGYFCHLANRLGYFNSGDYAGVKTQIESVSKCLASYIRAVEVDS